VASGIVVGLVSLSLGLPRHRSACCVVVGLAALLLGFWCCCWACVVVVGPVLLSLGQLAQVERDHVMYSI